MEVDFRIQALGPTTGGRRSVLVKVSAAKDTEWSCASSSDNDYVDCENDEFDRISMKCQWWSVEINNKLATSRERQQRHSVQVGMEAVVERHQLC